MCRAGTTKTPQISAAGASVFQQKYYVRTLVAVCFCGVTSAQGRRFDVRSGGVGTMRGPSIICECYVLHTNYHEIGYRALAQLKIMVGFLDRDLMIELYLHLYSKGCGSIFFLSSTYSNLHQFRGGTVLALGQLIN